MLFATTFFVGVSIGAPKPTVSFGTDRVAAAFVAGSARPLAATDSNRTTVPNAETVGAHQSSQVVVAVPDSIGVVAVPDSIGVVAVPDSIGVVAVPDSIGVVAIPDSIGVIAVPDALKSSGRSTMGLTVPSVPDAVPVIKPLTVPMIPDVAHRTIRGQSLTTTSIPNAFHVRLIAR